MRGFTSLPYLMITIIIAKGLRVPLTSYGFVADETTRLISLMRIGNRPPNHSFATHYYSVTNVTCTSKVFSFSIGSQLHFECPKHNGKANRVINDTHELKCPTYCEVCKNITRCFRGKSASGIIYTPDGRKKDQVSFQYGTLDRHFDRSINWFIVACYISLFALFTNIVAYAFT